MAAIFKRDLRAFFTSPLGYVYVSFFILGMNLYFYIANIANPYSDLSGAYSAMLIAMMLTTPILTMRSFSEEMSQKTDQLILTSPVKLHHVVLGKFFACGAVFGVVAVLTLLWPLIVSIYGAPNAAQIIGSYLALSSAASVYISIGIFISSLTENQLVSSIGSLGFFVALFLLDLLSASIVGAVPSWVTRAINFISIFDRFNMIKQGILSLADIVFYLSVSAAFIFMTVRILEKKRWS